MVGHARNAAIGIILFILVASLTWQAMTRSRESTPTKNSRNWYAHWKPVPIGRALYAKSNEDNEEKLLITVRNKPSSGVRGHVTALANDTGQVCLAYSDGTTHLRKLQVFIFDPDVDRQWGAGINSGELLPKQWGWGTNMRFKKMEALGDEWIIDLLVQRRGIYTWLRSDLNNPNRKISEAQRKQMTKWQAVRVRVKLRDDKQIQFTVPANNSLWDRKIVRDTAS